MKTPDLLGMTALALIVGGLGFGCANPQPPARQTRAGLILDDRERVAVVTGSTIPQKVKVKSIGTDSVHSVRIYTQEEIKSTGASTISEGLALDPSITFSGR